VMHRLVDILAIEGIVIVVIGLVVVSAVSS